MKIDESRDRLEYILGRNAYHESKTMADCPYMFGEQRIAWLVGWLDGRTCDKLSHIFAKYKLEYP